MSAIAIITFTYSCTEDELAAFAMDFAQNVKPRTEGLVWKIFLNRTHDRRSAGVYLFRDAESAQGYVDGPYVRRLREMPILTDFSAEVFDTMAEASARAGAPL